MNKTTQNWLGWWLWVLNRFILSKSQSSYSTCHLSLGAEGNCGALMMVQYKHACTRWVWGHVPSEKIFKLGALRWLLRLYPNATNPTRASGRSNTALCRDARQLWQGASFSVVNFVYVEADKVGSYTYRCLTTWTTTVSILYFTFGTISVITHCKRGHTGHHI